MARSSANSLLQRELLDGYSGAAEPQVRSKLSHLSGGF